MEFVRKVVDASILNSIIALPESLKNRRLEIIVLPADEKTLAENRDIVKNAQVSRVDSLVGILGHEDITLEQIREERLSKYENTN